MAAPPHPLARRWRSLVPRRQSGALWALVLYGLAALVGPGLHLVAHRADHRHVGEGLLRSRLAASLAHLAHTPHRDDAAHPHPHPEAAPEATATAAGQVARLVASVPVAESPLLHGSGSLSHLSQGSLADTAGLPTLVPVRHAATSPPLVPTAAPPPTQLRRRQAARAPPA